MQKFAATYKHPTCLYEDLFRELIRANILQIIWLIYLMHEILGLVNRGHQKH